jgi:glycosyltransferase involved in cell wall biosynthesis
MTRPLLSVIVPYFDEAEHLEACLRSILVQRAPAFEVLAIDDGSGDASPAIVARLARSSKGRLRALAQDHKGPGAARNLGAREARGRILVFVDADMTAAPGFLARITAPIRAGKEHGSFVVDELVANPQNPWSRAWSQAHGLPPERRLPAGMPERANTYRAVRRDRFLAAGGHHEDRGVGEDEMDSRRLKPGLAVPGAVLYHANPGSAREVWLSARWYGRGKAVWVPAGTLLRLAWTHCPPRSLAAAFYGALRHRSAFFFAFKLLFDLAVCVGLVQGRLFGKLAR